MATPADAPLLPAGSQHLEARVRRRLGELTERAGEILGSRLEAVILGGSLARGEGAVLRVGPREVLASDIDLYLVVRSWGEHSAGELRREILGRVQEDAFFAAGVDLGLVDREWFGRLGPTIPAHQLALAHRVLAGDPGCLQPLVSSIPTEGPWSIDGDDALVLTMNRFAESLVVAEEPLSNPLALYRRWKLWLDAPLAWLAAHGLYHLDRRVQLKRLEETWLEAGGGDRPWFAEGVCRHRRMLDALENGPVDLDLVAELPFPARRGRGGVLSWAWPFFRGVLGSKVGEYDSAAGASLVQAVEAGSPSRWDVAWAKEWLRRRPFLRRMREARRWARNAPGGQRPWWRYGMDGMGKERVQMACALKFGALPDWLDLLKGLIPTRILVDAARGPQADRWLGELWSSWVRGGVG